MRSVELDEAQAGIKTVGRNINNLRYADDTTLMAESEEELKSLLMKVKEESEKVGLSSTKIMASGPITQRRQRHPTPVLLPGKPHGWRSLGGCSPWGLQRVGHD